MIKFPKRLYNLYNKNKDDTRMKINKVLLEKPATSDGPGYVYGYFFPVDRNTKTDFWIKIGRTEREDPFKRIKEQGGKIIFFQITCYDRKLENLSHLFLDYCKTTREINEENKIEWFHLTENMNVPKYIAMINELIEICFNVSLYEQIPFKEPVRIKSIKKEKTKILNNSKTNSNTIINNFNKCGTVIKLKKPKGENICKIININTASKKELEENLPGIGKGFSDKIVSYRTTVRPFRSIEEIKHIYGIGEITFNKIRNRIIV